MGTQTKNNPLVGVVLTSIVIILHKAVIRISNQVTKLVKKTQGMHIFVIFCKKKEQFTVNV